MVNVYDGNKVIARVKYNENLDFWDGSNMTCGELGRHKGLTKLKSGKYVLIHGTQFAGQSPSAEIISAEEALQEILHSGNTELFHDYPELEELKDETIEEEV